MVSRLVSLGRLRRRERSPRARRQTQSPGQEPSRRAGDTTPLTDPSNAIPPTGCPLVQQDLNARSRIGTRWSHLTGRNPLDCHFGGWVRSRDFCVLILVRAQPVIVPYIFSSLPIFGFVFDIIANSRHLGIDS